MYPLSWSALTLARGAIIHVFPYDFVDVTANVSVIVTIAALTAAACALAAGAVSVDRRLTKRYSMVP